jgi:hypothetical protein
MLEIIRVKFVEDNQHTLRGTYHDGNKNWVGVHDTLPAERGRKPPPRNNEELT